MHRVPNGVICSGNIVYDTLACVEEEPRWGTSSFAERIEYHVGGNGANTSIALATLGIPVRLLGAIGDDAQGQFAGETLRRAGVDTSSVIVVNAPTAASVVLVNRAGERKLLHCTGASDTAFAEPVDFTGAVTAGMAHYHLASIFGLPLLRLHAETTLARARAAGLRTSLDTNWDPHGRWMQDLAPCLEHLDILFMNEDEAAMATRQPTPSAAADSVLRRGASAAVIKLGARGCGIYSGTREWLCPAFEVQARDTTGAGDCFVAGFLAALLLDASLEEAGRFANAVAALSIQRIGGAAGAPSYADVESLLRSASPR